MCRLDVYKVSRRAFAARRRGPPRCVPLSIQGRRVGHFCVRMRAVHVVDVVLWARARVYGVSISFACMWNRWPHKGRRTARRADPTLVYKSLGGKGLN